MRYADRREAGRHLARVLADAPVAPEAIVLALPRGGVPVGYEVAMARGVSLDVFLVRKLGVPGHEELAMGAIASGGVRVVNELLVERLGIDEADIEAVAREELRELARRERLYRGDRPAADVRGREVVVVDDGLATGSTMRAAVAALRRLGAARTVAAAPVGSRDTCGEVEDLADAVICAQPRTHFRAVGEWYDDFSQTTDDEVCELLRRARATEAGVVG